MDADPDRLPAPWSVLGYAAGLLALLAMVLYLVATAKDTTSFGATWYTDLIWLPELVAIGAIVRTRSTAAVGLLAGIVAWEWLMVAAFPHTGVQNSEAGWRWLLAAAAANVAAQVCGLVAVGARVGRPRPAGSSAPAWLVVGGLVTAGLAVLATNVGARVQILAFELTLDELAPLRYLAVVLCAVTVPVAVLAHRSRRTRLLVLVGWTLGALDSMANQILGGYQPKSAIGVALGLAGLAAGAGAGFVVIGSRWGGGSAGAPDGG